MPMIARIALLVLVAAFAFLAFAGAAFTAPTPEERYVSESRGGIAWGWRACNAWERYRATRAETVAWLVVQRGLSADQARTVVGLAHEHLCPDAWPHG